MRFLETLLTIIVVLVLFAFGHNWYQNEKNKHGVTMQLNIEADRRATEATKALESEKQKNQQLTAELESSKVKLNVAVEAKADLEKRVFRLEDLHLSRDLTCASKQSVKPVVAAPVKATKKAKKAIPKALLSEKFKHPPCLEQAEFRSCLQAKLAVRKSNVCKVVDPGEDRKITFSGEEMKVDSLTHVEKEIVTTEVTRKPLQLPAEPICSYNKQQMLDSCEASCKK